jgi:hypothetical protein
LLVKFLEKERCSDLAFVINLCPKVNRTGDAAADIASLFLGPGNSSLFFQPNFQYDYLGFTATIKKLPR